MGKIPRASARGPSRAEAAEALKELAEVTISPRQAGRIAHEVGQQLQADRVREVVQAQARSLPARVQRRPALAVVGVDGGRLPIRGQGEGPGAHDSSWREAKTAVLATVAIHGFDRDPEPGLPDGPGNRDYVETLVSGMSGQTSMSPPDPQTETPADVPATPPDKQDKSRTRPELLVRTSVASTCSSDRFGPIVAAEAPTRNFLQAACRAFLGAGAAWIWKLQRADFPTFEAIVDFLHVLGHLFAAAKAVETATEPRWALFQSRAEACGQERVDQVIDQ